MPITALPRFNTIAFILHSFSSTKSFYHNCNCVQMLSGVYTVMSRKSFNVKLMCGSAKQVFVLSTLVKFGTVFTRPLTFFVFFATLLFVTCVGKFHIT